MARSTDRDVNILLTAIGIGLALVVPPLYALLVGPALVEPRTTAATYALVGFALYWTLSLCVLTITRFGERRPLASLGVKRLSWRMAGIAVGLGILLSLTVPLLTLLTSRVLPASESGTIADTASRFPAGIILLSVLTAGITEELLFRGYAIERLLELTGAPWVSAIISLALFVLAHASGWSLAHIVGVVLPLGAILTGLYLWQRNLLFVIIVHIFVDLPLVFFALGR